jgi:hypothetical protein
MLKPASIRPFGHFVSASLAVICVVIFGSSTFGQLKVLSKGNTVEEWRKAQLAQIDAQLNEKSTAAELKSELESAKKWLSAYQPGSMSAKAAAPEKKEEKPLIEPIVDPDESAGALRRKLLGPKAKPSAADTEALRIALQKSPEDVGLRQLQLHWLDQPQYRDDYSAEIAEAAGRLLALLEGAKLKPEQKKLAIAFTLYRQARAFGYRQDPDVVKKYPLDEQERKRYEEQLVGAYNQLINLVGSGQSEFALLEIRMLRHDKWNAQALELLEENAHLIEPRWYLEKRRDILRDLGWKTPAEEAHAIYSREFPNEASANP